ncbi:hypothetical protein A5804_002121 [Enterococcus faecium]|uniref:Uncharacterized protein n=1 Tax=Enterococcus faecium TaxID=1352 RepID=A0AB73N545_ENTFC|nr:hypothetical protein [Enterococcus faecium]OTO00609.1 hypothetical protein A5804_002121 [Enterococcus faecium]
MLEEPNNLLKVTVKKRQENPVRGAHYEVKVNDLVLGRGISRVAFDMPAGERPRMTIEAYPDEVIFDELQAEIKVKPLGQFKDSPAEE